MRSHRGRRRPPNHRHARQFPGIGRTVGSDRRSTPARPRTRWRRRSRPIRRFGRPRRSPRRPRRYRHSRPRTSELVPRPGRRRTARTRGGRSDRGLQDGEHALRALLEYDRGPLERRDDLVPGEAVGRGARGGFDLGDSVLFHDATQADRQEGPIPEPDDGPKVTFSNPGPRLTNSQDLPSSDVQA